MSYEVTYKDKRDADESAVAETLASIDDAVDSLARYFRLNPISLQNMEYWRVYQDGKPTHVGGTDFTI